MKSHGAFKLKRNPIFRLFKQWLLAVMHMISHHFRLFLIQTIIKEKDCYGYLFINSGIKRKRVGFNFQAKAFCWKQLNNNNYNKDIIFCLCHFYFNLL